jgi:hypothetical protein
VFEDYRIRYGDLPAVNEEPTTEQLGAIRQLLDGGQPPYVDFAIFGPHGRRTLRKLTHASMQYNAVDGSWKRRELDGPSSFQQWW